MLELVKEKVLGVGGDAFARVGDGDWELAGSGTELDSDAAMVGEFEAIADEVGDDLTDTVVVAGGGGVAGGCLEFEGKTVEEAGILVFMNDVLDERDGVEGLSLDDELALLETGDVEEVVDDGDETEAGGVDVVDHLVEVGVFDRFAVLIQDKTGIATDSRERRAEFV